MKQAANLEARLVGVSSGNLTQRYDVTNGEVDEQAVDWIESSDDYATAEQFESFMVARYAEPDLLWRFPSGFGELP